MSDIETNIGKDLEEKPRFTPEYIAQRKAERHLLNRYISVVFDSEAEWIRFLEHVYDEYGGPVGATFGDLPIPMNIRLSPELLETTHTQFSYRLPRENEVQEYLALNQCTRQFDPKSIKSDPTDHVPGLGHFRPNTA